VRVINGTGTQTQALSRQRYVRSRNLARKSGEEKVRVKALSDVSWVGEQNFKYFAIDWEDRSSFHSITSPGATLDKIPVRPWGYTTVVSPVGRMQ
jgi:hypothetical protein